MRSRSDYTCQLDMYTLQSFHTPNINLIYVKKKITKNKYVSHKQTTTTELQAPDLGQGHAYRMWRG